METKVSFKVGDKVKCIEVDGFANLKHGHIYTVQRLSGAYIKVDNDTECEYRPARFELVDTCNMTFKVGDKVKCIDDGAYAGIPGGRSRFLDKNVIYTVLENDGDLLKVDNYISGWYNPNRFALVEPEAVPNPRAWIEKQLTELYAEKHKDFNNFWSLYQGKIDILEQLLLEVYNTKVIVDTNPTLQFIKV